MSLGAVGKSLVSCRCNTARSVFGRTELNFPPENSLTPKSGYRMKVYLLGKLVEDWFDITSEDRSIVCCFDNKVGEKDLCSWKKWGWNSLLWMFHQCGSHSERSLFLMSFMVFLYLSGALFFLFFRSRSGGAPPLPSLIAPLISIYLLIIFIGRVPSYFLFSPI